MEKRDGRVMGDGLKDAAHMMQDIPYPNPLPKEIEGFHAYLIDSGHGILCISDVF